MGVPLVNWRVLIIILLVCGMQIPRPAIAAGAQESVCIQCHSALPAKLSMSVKFWKTSVHGENGISCTICHGGDPQDALRSMSPERGFRGIPAPTSVASLCGGCHMGVNKFYMNSAHGKALGAGGPTCVTCHGSHGIKRASLELISKKYCSTCHTFEKARMIRSAMLKRDTMLMAIEKKIQVLKQQGVDTDKLEKRLFALRNRFHAMFHSLDIKMIILESDHIQAELENARGAGGMGTGPMTGTVAIGGALLAALLFYLIKKNIS